MKKIWVVQYNDGTADIVDDDPDVNFVAPSWPYVDAFEAETEIKRLRNVLHSISLGSQSSMTMKEDLGKQAKEALK